MAAGLGFKNFTTGEVLTAADTNGFLMQGVLVFSDTAARDAAITAPAEGQFCFTKDTNTTFFYDGAVWVVSGATGDIEGVTAGVGISGGGTSGTVTITNSMATEIDAKGDLIVGTGADTFSRLAVGANGTILQADSSEATGLKFVASGGGGKVLQVVFSSVSTSTNNSTNGFIDTGLTATITPTLATSQVLVLVNQAGIHKSDQNSNNQCLITLLRGGTTIISEFAGLAGLTATAVNNFVGSVSASYLDQPATTSATTYKTQFKNGQNSAQVGVNSSNSTSTIVLMEIGV